MKPSCRFLLSLLMASAVPAIASASSPSALSTYQKEVVSKCGTASGLKSPKLVGDVVEYDDSIGYSAALISGTYPQPHMRNAPGHSLCLFNKRSRKAAAAPADGMK
ncbi:MAG: hypothetical protein ACO24O_08745 [Arenimonas sp.]